MVCMTTRRIRSATAIPREGSTDSTPSMVELDANPATSDGAIPKILHQNFFGGLVRLQTAFCEAGTQARMPIA